MRAYFLSGACWFSCCGSALQFESFVWSCSSARKAGREGGKEGGRAAQLGAGNRECGRGQSCMRILQRCFCIMRRNCGGSDAVWLAKTAEVVLR